MPKITGKTYVEPGRVLAAVTGAGLEPEALSSFYKVRGDGGKRIYIPRTKGVGRIDISGFTMPPGTPGIIELGDRSFGAVKQQLDFEGRSEADVLRTLNVVIRALKGERARAARPASRARAGRERAQAAHRGSA